MHAYRSENKAKMGSLVSRQGRSTKEITRMMRRAIRKQFRKAVENVMSIFDEKSRKAVYYHLEKNWGFILDDLPEGVDKLDQGLRTIFGNKATELIEGRIIMELSQSLGRNPSEGKKSLVEFAKEIIHDLEMGN